MTPFSLLRELRLPQVIGFVEADVDRVAACELNARHRFCRAFRSEQVDASYLTHLQWLAEKSSSPSLAIETASNWAALVGDDPHTSAAGCAIELHCRTIVVTIDGSFWESGASPAQGDTLQFTLTDGSNASDDVQERTVSIGYEMGEWVFYQEGSPLKFESLATYRRRSIPERFTFEMLNEYCRTFGIDITQLNFFGPKAYRIHI